jgi:DNA-binding CsgD family transcriptional regulator
MASEVELLSLLIGEIYDAALDASRWVDITDKLRAFIVGSAASLYAKDAASKRGGVLYEDGGIDPYYRALYFDQYIKLDPSTVSMFFAKVGEPLSTADLMPYEEFTATRFYQEWVRPQGLVDALNVILEKSSTSIALFGVFRHERDGLVDDKMRDRMRLVVPHVRRAVLIGKIVDFKTAEAATFADTLDGLIAGMFLLDAAGRVVHANTSGLAMLDRGTPLRPATGKLAAADAAADQALREAFIAAANGDAAMGTKGIAVPLPTQDGARYVAHVLPLTAGARRQANISYSAVAAMFVHQAALSSPSPLETIAKLYKLTPSELRVLNAVVEIGGVAAVAETLGISEATVKTHLQHLFEKTGTRRQIDLAKLVASHASPLIR